MGLKHSKRLKPTGEEEKDEQLQDQAIDASVVPLDTKPTRSSSSAEWCAWIRNRLNKQYHNLVMQGLPWMGNVSITLDNYDVTLTIIKEDQYGEVEDDISGVNTIFDSIRNEGNQPVRILVEGAPGYGKTTLASKLCFDYATQKNYIKDYELVLYYPGHLFQGEVEEIFEWSTNVKVPSDVASVLSVIKNNSRKILLVFDGLDEVPKQFLKSLLPFLRGELFPHLTVIVTRKPGKFSSRMESPVSARFATSNDEVIQWKDIWNNRIKIKGISTKIQQEFALQHLSNISETTKSEVIRQLEQLKLKKLILPEYLECPLFFLMIILVLTDTPTMNIATLKTRTDLYKLVLNFAFCQYFRKVCDTKVRKINLFSINKVQKPEEVVLFTNFGQFALEALNTDKGSFSKMEILGNVNKRDERILQLGLLTCNKVSALVEEAQTGAMYEPVHKSLMEFAAAYALWMQFSDNDLEQWIMEVNYLVSNRRFGISSLLFPFLTGLMGDLAGNLLQALTPLATDYLANWNGWLRICVPELLLTEAILQSLTSFLPVDWTKKWDELILAHNPRRMTILRHAVKVGRIEWMTWRVGDSLNFPSDVAVKKATLLATSRAPKNCIRFCCRHLVCIFSDCIFLPEFRSLMSVLPTIDYECISFTLSKRLDLVPFSTIRSAITTGMLKDAHIYVIKCNLENEFQSLKMLGDLIKANRLDVLNASIGPDSSQDSSLDVSWNNPSEVEQEQINSLAKCAANSSQLTSLILENDSRTTFTIDLSDLCNGVKKSWECLVLRGFKIRCPQDIVHYFKVKHLHITDDGVTYPLFKFVRSCEVTSLCCPISSLSSSGHLTFSHAFLKELNLILDESIINLGRIQLPTRLQNLQTLILTMTTFKCKSYPQLEISSFFDSCNLLRFKGIEIWHIKRNRELALKLSKNIFESLAERTSSPPMSQPKKLHLHYFLMHDGRGYFDFSLEFLIQVKTTLKTKCLSRLDMVDEISSFSSVRTVFSTKEQFRVEEGLWGTSEKDSIQSRVQCDLFGTRKLQKRCSVIFDPQGQS